MKCGVARAAGLVLAAAGLLACGDSGAANGIGGADAAAEPTGDTAQLPDGGGDALPVDADGDAHPDADDVGPDYSGWPDAAVERQLIEAIPAARTLELAGLESPVHVVHTEAGVPHIYAASRLDLQRAYGFVIARDRLLSVDLARRLALGELTPLLGDVALSRDEESRSTGIHFAAKGMLQALSAEHLALIEAFAAGLNEGIAAIEAGVLPGPSEFELAGPLLGASEPAELLVPFDALDITAILALSLFQSSYEVGDVAREEARRRLEAEDVFEGAAMAALRRLGALEDIATELRPVVPIASADGFGLDGRPLRSSDGTERHAAGLRSTQAPRAAPRRPRLPLSLLSSASERLAATRRRLMRPEEGAWGSNAWAVSGEHTVAGEGLLAGDGHLPLSVPALLYQIGLDTRVFGGGDIHQLGLTLPGAPFVALGTNGFVAWSQTQFGGDITDWFAEELQLGPDGLPAATLAGDAWATVTRVDEAYVIADVPALGSEGRTEVRPRFVTSDGRWLAFVEGRPPTDTEWLDSTAPIAWFGGEAIVPEDTDGDGVVSGLSFDYVGLDPSALPHAVDAMGRSWDVEMFRQATRGLVAYSQNLVATDSAGHVLYTGYQPIPCRGNLARTLEGDWEVGSDPDRVLDGNAYGGFTVEIEGGAVVEYGVGTGSAARCTVPFDEFPHAIDPARGYVLNANNDPGGLTFDGSVTHDDWYLGGPWDVGYRAETIDRELAALVADGSADVQSMGRLQGEVTSRLAEHQLETLLELLDSTDVPAERTAEVDEARQRLMAWAGRGHSARSGVETFYASPDATAREDAVATTIWNAWHQRFLQAVFADEGLPGGTFLKGGGATRTLHHLLAGRGAGNPLGLASWSAATGESVFFDRRGTEAVETSAELARDTLLDALDWLQSSPGEPGKGGFGSPDMDTWLWGLRHQVRFESLLEEFLGDDPAYELLTSQFSIDTGVLPLATGLAGDDPRAGLRWFPRDGDNESVDAADTGSGGKSFTYGSGPVMRMVIALRDGEVWGQNVLPGGQSGLTDSPHFADQAALWLANETIPLRFHAQDVAAGAVDRWLLTPVAEEDEE